MQTCKSKPLLSPLMEDRRRTDWKGREEEEEGRRVKAGAKLAGMHTFSQIFAFGRAGNSVRGKVCLSIKKQPVKFSRRRASSRGRKLVLGCCVAAARWRICVAGAHRKECLIITLSAALGLLYSR